MQALASILANWKTTSAGAAAFAYALGDVYIQVYTREWSAPRLHSDAVAILAGIGFIFAKDHNVTGGEARVGGVLDTNAISTEKLAQLKAAGYQTIIRYISTNTTSPKTVKLAEARAIAAAGMRLGLVFEVWGGVNNFTHNDINAATGAAHGAFAARWATTVGAPPSAVIYFAIDTDATNAQIQQLVVPYFAAAKQAIGARFRVGVYGCGAACAAVLDAGHADKAWLTNAMGWNGSRAFKASGRAALVQSLPKVIAGLDTDPDTAMPSADIGDFVPFSPGDAPAPPPAPVPPSGVGIVTGDNAVARLVAAKLRAAGAAEAGIAGVLGNIKQESDWNPRSREADQPRFSGEAHYAHGLFQMGGDEWNSYASWLNGRDWTDPANQVDFLIEELHKNYAHLWEQLKDASDPAAAALAFSSSYERPSPKYANNANRVKWAQHYYDTRKPTPTPEGKTAPMTDTAPTVLSSIPGLPSLAGLATVHNEIGMFLKIAPTIVGATSVFIPQMKVVAQALPLLQELHDFVGDLEASGGDPTKMLAAIESHIGKIFAAAKALAPA